MKSKANQSSSRGIFVFGRETLVMRKWQILEFDGKPYYAFVQESDVPIKEEAIPELSEYVAHVPDDQPQMVNNEVEEEPKNYQAEETLKPEVQAEQKDEADVSMEEQSITEGVYEIMDDENSQASDAKAVVINGKVQSPDKPEEKETEEKNAEDKSDWYQIKMEGGVLLLEKLDIDTSQQEGSVEGTIAGQTVVIEEDDSRDYQEFEVLEEEQEESNGEVVGPGELDDEVVAVVQSDSAPAQEEKSSVALKCKACSETFESTIAFRKHVAWTHKKKLCIQENGTYICSVCDYRTSKKSQLVVHLQRKHETWPRKRDSGSNLFPCAACGFVCRSKHSLQSHFIRKHTDRYEHQCKFCTKKFKVKGDLTNHVRFHHKEKPINCDVCGKRCLNSGSLYVHQKWAHYKPKYECRICKRRMVTQENLDQHMLMQHEKREKIVCAECGKTFTKKDSFKRHMAVHTGSKPYQCVICNKPFARRSQLRQHLLIHTGKRPFICDICGKAFTQKPGLICHRKTHPGNHPPLPVMYIGDIVKEFTEGYLAGNKDASKKDGEGAEEDEEDQDEEEEYEEELETVEIVEEEASDAKLVEE